MTGELIIAAAVFLLLLAVLAVLGRMLALLGRLEASVRRLAERAAPAERARADRAEAEQERYARGVANILAYGTREMLKRGDGAR